MHLQVTINIGNNNPIRPDIVIYKNDLPVLFEKVFPSDLSCS